MALIELPCDLCGGTVFRELYPSTISDPADKPERYFSSGRQRAGHLRIVQCLTCGLQQSNPRDQAATILQVYRQLDDPAYSSEESHRRWTARRYARLLQRFDPAPGKLLDVGCSTGLFLQEAQSLGWAVWGLEPSQAASALARQRLPAADILSCAIEEAEFPPESFDAITLWDVLEHLDSPRQALLRLNGWLRPGGLLLVNLPDAASLPARLLGSHWVLLLREHLWYFTPQTYRLLLEKTGFEWVNGHPHWVRFSLSNILLRLAQYPGWLSTGWRQMAQFPPLKKIAVSFPMGELTAVAVKRAA